MFFFKVCEQKTHTLYDEKSILLYRQLCDKVIKVENFGKF